MNQDKPLPPQKQIPEIGIAERARLFEEALELLCIADHNGRFLQVNREWERVLGYPERELLGCEYLNLVHPDDVSTTREAMAALAERSVVRDFVNRFRHRDGHYLWLEWRAVPQGDYIYSLARDITASIHAREALMESEERFRALFENMTEGVALHELLYDAEGKPDNYRITAVNPAYAGHTGLTAEAGVGKLATELYRSRQPPYLAEFFRVAETRESFRFETYFPPLEKHFSISVISPKKGEFATVFEDITERKRTESELRQKNRDLERFIYTVSHDLKSPLVTIKAFCSYLKADMAKNDPGILDKDLGYIQNAADKMGALLDELLEFSRIGRKESAKRAVPLTTIVDAAAALVAGRLRARGAELSVTPLPVQLFGIPQRLIQVYQNLLDNAVKFGVPEQPPRIEVGAAVVEGEIHLFVRDQGIGIDPRHGDKLFGLFEKLTPGSEGTGIGLAVVKRIIEVHGGRIWFESKGLNQGTTFWFTLDRTHIETEAG